MKTYLIKGIYKDNPIEQTIEADCVRDAMKKFAEENPNAAIVFCNLIDYIDICKS